MPIALLFYAHVSGRAKLEVKRVTQWLEETQEHRHRVSVLVVSNRAVRGYDGLTGFGISVFRSHRSPEMCLAAGVVDVAQEYGGTEDDGLELLAETYLHEWAHYEQWRDRRPVQERGVAVRARNLLKQYHRSSRPL